MTVLASNPFPQPLGRAELARPKPGSVRIGDHPGATPVVDRRSLSVIRQSKRRIDASKSVRRFPLDNQLKSMFT
jgi:hypothetical protein